MSAIGVNLVGSGVGGAVRLGGGAATDGTVKSDQGGPASSFADALKGVLEQTNAAIREGDAAAAKLASGEAPSLHEVVLATEQANLALQFTMAIRNKILEAYQELMRMPV